MVTKQELIEIKKCKEDPIYFISNYIKVVHPVRGLVPFDLYPFQKKIINEVESNRFNILRKFRQAGCTTIASAYSLWFTMFFRHKTVAVLSKGEVEATEIIDRIRVMYDELPAFIKNIIKPTKGSNNKHVFGFENGSLVKSRASGKQTGRSLAGSLLIIDEAAFIEQIETIWAAVYPILSTGGRAFVLSTVNGVGNWYHQTYMGAVNKTNSFNAIDIHWKEHPEYYRNEGYEHLYEDMMKRNPPVNVDDWERVTKSNVSPKIWRQEYEGSFEGTGDTFIEAEILAGLADGINHDFRTEYSGRLRIWENPQPMYEYLLSVDVALGKERDYSAFHIINTYNGKQVAEFYSNKTNLNEFAEIIHEKALEYNLAYVAIEINAIGYNLINYLTEILEYENVMLDEKGDFGFKTTVSNREQMLVDMEEYIRMRYIRVSSERLVNELNTFIIDDNNKITADINAHDDLIMSLAIGVKAFKQLTNGTPLEHNQYEIESKPPELTRSTKYLSKQYQGIDPENIKWLLQD